MPEEKVVIVGAGINGLVAANYLRRAGCDVTVIERGDRVGGACVSASVNLQGKAQQYALGASVLGLMQDYVFRETGLADRLETFVPEQPKLVFFPGDRKPARIFRDPAELDRELADRWGESGDVEAFRNDEARVVHFLQQGYRAAQPPTLDDARDALGPALTDLWISGSARDLLDHYLTAERSKVYMAMTVTESGPVSLFSPFSAFTLPLMDSGSIFGGYYGFVSGGIWRITEELDRINRELGVTTKLAARVRSVDTAAGGLLIEQDGQEQSLRYDQLLLATDPMTAIRLTGKEEDIRALGRVRFRGSSGKLNLMFDKPVRWKHGAADADSAFRFLFSVDSLDAFERATLKVMDDDIAYEPGYMQVYCEGAAMRELGLEEPFDRLAVFFKNLSVVDRGDLLPDVEKRVRETVLAQIENAADCIWSRLLTPRDLKNLFHFPGGNLDHTMLLGGQTYFDRNFSAQPSKNFYGVGELENVYVCGSGTYPCGSVTGTAGYMCSQQLLRSLNKA
ncbi:MAG: NAD(P)/FAD-dependent oxidoreductase [Gammaproteobacteria bacterium]|nr:NAD(P)/FAD-dependent oxidoreductase [Gammaproteobacteria bacterium]